MLKSRARDECTPPKRNPGSAPAAGLNIAETMDTGNIKNCGMAQEPRMFCEESLGKVNARDLELFWNSLVHEFYICLKVLITL